MAKYKHKEAFALMWYACPCGHRERIWNSRDGVTPFGGLPCVSCGGQGMDKNGLSHIDIHLDERAPNHNLRIGQQFFRDGTTVEAVDIMRKRFDHFEKAGRPVPDRSRALLLGYAREGTGEWIKGWPVVRRWMGES